MTFLLKVKMRKTNDDKYNFFLFLFIYRDLKINQA